jgi:hypothetical protein
MRLGNSEPVDERQLCGLLGYMHLEPSGGALAGIGP